jgi:hypothetical protein
VIGNNRYRNIYFFFVNYLLLPFAMESQTAVPKKNRAGEVIVSEPLLTEVLWSR